MISWLLLIAAVTVTAVLFGPSGVASAAVGAAKILGVVILVLGGVAWAHRGRPGTKTASLVRSMSSMRPR